MLHESYEAELQRAHKTPLRLYAVASLNKLSAYRSRQGSTARTIYTLFLKVEYNIMRMVKT